MFVQLYFLLLSRYCAQKIEAAVVAAGAAAVVAAVVLLVAAAVVGAGAAAVGSSSGLLLLLLGVAKARLFRRYSRHRSSLPPSLSAALQSHLWILPQSAQC